MSTLYENNMSILRARQPVAATEIDRAVRPEDRRTIVSRQGAAVFQYRQNGVWRSLTSAYDPMREATQQVQAYDLEGAKIIFVIGEAGLYHLAAVLDKASDNAKVMLMSVSPSYLKLAFESRDVRGILSDERLVIVASQDMEYIKSATRTVIAADLYDVPTFALVIHPIENSLQGEFVYSFQQSLHWYYTISLTSVNTTQFFEHWWSHNFVANIPYLLTGTKVSRLANTWSGKPAIIVGAGPSLNKNLQLLKDAEGKALILCVDTAYRILQKAGVKPDLLVTLDGSPMNVRHLEGCEYAGVPMFFDEYSHRDITTAHHGPKVVNSNGMFHEHWWNRVYDGAWESSSIPTGGSVATTGFSLARLMGANPVIMMGVDLSYPEGQLYADGALHAGKTVDSQTQRKFFEVEDIHGRTVRTTHDYLVYLRWLEMEAQKGDRTYINATEGGALKKGFKVMSMSDCIAEYLHDEQPVCSWKEQLETPPDAEKFPVVLRNLKRSQREMKAAVAYLKRLTRLSEDYRQLQESELTDSSSELAAEMSRVQKKLVAFPFAMDFLDAHSFQAVYNDIKMTELTAKDADNLTQREQATLRATQMVALFSQLRDIAQSSIEMHADGIRLLNELLRHEEEILVESAQCV